MDLERSEKLGIQISKRHFQYLNRKQNIILRKELVIPPERWYRRFLDLMSNPTEAERRLEICIPNLRINQNIIFKFQQFQTPVKYIIRDKICQDNLQKTTKKLRRAKTSSF